MFTTRYMTPRELVDETHHRSDTQYTLNEEGHPSGRLGGPGVPSPRRHHDHMLASAGMESYNALAGYEETLSGLRKALSQRGFEILRECELGPKLRTRRGAKPARCRILYVAEPELLATGVSTHASAALWLPIPVVVSEHEEFVTILRPAEAIVWDRAALLGLRALVERSYRNLTEALASVAIPE
jgi:uncharacterized protein (DUF302 family)